LGRGGTSGVGTDNSETFRLGNWESEVVGETSMFTLTPLNKYVYTYSIKLVHFI